MADDKFSWKGLFINDSEGVEESESVKSETPKRKVSTKQSVSKFPESAPSVSPVNSNTLSTIIEMYEAGFESLNKPGYDFYEFFKAIKAVGSNDPSVYKMALSMAQSVESKVTKTTLLIEANYYIDEIKKVHKQYETQGKLKKTQFQNSQETQKRNLKTEISGLERELLELQNKISAKKNQLQSLDSNEISEIAEIDQKIIANDQAKEKILETITTVVDGINNNI